MFKLPRSRKNYYSSSYYRKPKRYPKISLWWLILAIPLSLLGLELLAQIYVNLAGKGEKAGIPIVNAYRLKFKSENAKPIEGLESRGELAVRRSSSTAYQLVAPQKNQFWQINEQGFRDRDPLPLAKPKQEIRIFILGGSVAFGQGVEKNEATISHQLEVLLNQRVAQQKQSPEKYRPDVFPFFKPSREKLFQLPAKIRPGQYRTIDGAVPGYASGNELAQLALKVLPYQPDLLVVLDGYADLMLPSDRFQADIPKIDDFLQDAPGHFQTYFSQSFQQWLQGFALARTLSAWSFKSQPNISERSLPLNLNGKSLADYLPQDEAELKRRIARYRNNHFQLIRLAASAGIPTIIAIQPEITGRPVEKLAPAEKAIRDQLGRKYLERLPQAYKQLLQESQQLAKQFPQNVKVLNFYQFDPKVSQPVFSDAVHLTEAANAALAKQLYQNLTAWQKIQIIPANFYLKE